ncbi:protein CutA homolog isoform X2 [Paramacrobiotus metropolitanus]|uniref:protein CutA homolog isoform X2 n=1 Tax=Paramacrobiotus metropolitanus TaxID=2943436 RepID=UPI0024456491|nr:protein CutA homolog isoform X2 [Paramacrobiotus metropolitanus]
MLQLLKFALKFWVLFFLFAAVPSCMPIFGGLQSLLVTSFSLSRSIVRTVAMSSFTAEESFTVSYVTAPNDTVAKHIARGLVEKKLAACVNVVPGIVSIYTWKNETQEDSEVLMIIKSRKSILEEMTTFIRDNHPYDVCEVISTPIIQGNPPYMQWLGEVVKKP